MSVKFFYATTLPEDALVGVAPGPLLPPHKNLISTLGLLGLVLQTCGSCFSSPCPAALPIFLYPQMQGYRAVYHAAPVAVVANSSDGLM